MSIYGETPTGTVNGSNKVFTTAQPYAPGTTRVWVGGLRKDRGVDYTESAASTISFVTAPSSGADIRVDYDLSVSSSDYPVGEWTFGSDGSALYNGPTLFPAGIDPNSTKTAVAVFGPGGARVNIPPVFDGPPGLAPRLSKGTVSTLAAGSDAAFDLVETSPGGSGIASAYTVNVGIPQGETGAAAANTLISPQPSDLEGTPQASYFIGYDAPNSKAKWLPLVLVGLLNVTGIGSASNKSGVTTLTNINVPAQPNPYVPIIWADGVITGTANTQVDLVARLGGGTNLATGSQVARGRGPVGAILGTNPWPLALIPNFTSLLSGGYAKVAANTAQIFYLNAEQQDSSTDKYSVAAGASFTIGLLQLPS